MTIQENSHIWGLTFKTCHGNKNKLTNYGCSTSKRATEIRTAYPKKGAYCDMTQRNPEQLI